MHVEILKESGYEEAILGLSLSFNTEIERAEEVAKRLCNKDGGHNKFLESIAVWIDITAPRYWWQEFDTYRVGVTKQSESTMHTLSKSRLTQDNFEDEISQEYIDYLNSTALTISKEKLLFFMKNALPEGFLQRRIVCTNYKALRHIILQRNTHRLPQWRYFVVEVFDNLKHSSLLGLGDVIYGV